MSNPASTTQQYRVLMVCDFFFPQLGGVEMHMWSLAQHLLARGHKVVIMTHAYGRRQGVRWMAGGLKVYYLPLRAVMAGTALATFVAMYPLMRQIVIREGIDIVHGHQATSLMTEEAVVFAKVMGVKAVYTDHSLFGFDDAAGLHLAKYMRYTLAHVDAAVAVSHACRENLVLRAALAPECISVIPNAVDPWRFTPDPSLRHPQGTINVVVISRLVYRKGVDLVAPVIAAAARRDARLHFIIAGDGPKRLLLEEMRERHQLHARVELLGEVPHSQVRNVLCRGHIFLNCSLTDSFCMAVLEAAACGLHVVSTRVGGIPEVLPPGMASLAAPRVAPLMGALLSAAARATAEVERCALGHGGRAASGADGGGSGDGSSERFAAEAAADGAPRSSSVGGSAGSSGDDEGAVSVQEARQGGSVVSGMDSDGCDEGAVESDAGRGRGSLQGGKGGAAGGAAGGQRYENGPGGLHQRVACMYSWADVAERTEAVYARALRQRHPPLLSRFVAFRRVGSFGQLIASFIEAALHLLLCALEALQPRARIEIAPDWPLPPTARSGGGNGGSSGGDGSGSAGSSSSSSSCSSGSSLDLG